MIKKHRKSSFHPTNELCFFNAAPSPLGRLLAGGIGRGNQLNNWWNIEHPKDNNCNYYLVMMLQGSGGFYSNEYGFECNLAYGDFFIAFPGHKHRYAPGQSESWNEMCLGFEGTPFDMLCEDRLLSPRTPVWHLADPVSWYERLQAILYATRPSTPLGIAREVSCLLTFLLELLETATPKAVTPATSDWFERACIMLTADLSRPADLKKIAAELNMNYETFRRNFRQRAGKPPGKFFDEKRIGEACHRLKKTQISCWELAHYLGFCDEQHFSKRFKECTGLSPREYRAQYKTTVENSTHER